MCIKPLKLNTFTKSLFEFRGEFIGSSVFIELWELTCSPFRVSPPCGVGFYCFWSIEAFEFLMLMLELLLERSFGLSLPRLMSFESVGYCCYWRLLCGFCWTSWIWLRFWLLRRWASRPWARLIALFWFAESFEFDLYSFISSDFTCQFSPKPSKSMFCDRIMARLLPFWGWFPLSQN